MKQFEFEAQVKPDESVQLPAEVAAAVLLNQSIRVVVIIPDEQRRDPWEDLTAQSFVKDYSAGDSIYDEFPTR